MNKFSKFKIIFAILFLGLFGWAKNSQAANLYVRDGATGSTCSDWDLGSACDQLSTAENLAARGDTIFLAVGSYNAVTLNTAVSGTAYIYIKKATSGAHGTDTGWDSGYGDGQAVIARATVTTGYWDIDGITGGGPSSWKVGHGIKFYNTTYDTLFTMTNAPSNIAIRHSEFAFDTTEVSDSDAADHIYGNTAVSNFTLEYSYLHDSTRTFFLTRNWQNVLVQYNWFARNRSTSGVHAEGWSDNYGDYYTIRYNVWEDIEGTGVVVNLTGDDYNWEIYGNMVFWNDSTSAIYTGVNNGIFTTRSAAAQAYNWKIYNNSVFNHRGINASYHLYEGNSNAVYNNLWYRCKNYTITEMADSDYNTMIQCGSGNAEGEHDTDLPFGSDPYVDSANGDFRLSGALAGLALSAIYESDLTGVVRGTDGVWDRGAYEYVSGSSDIIPPANPTGLSVS
ncbi:MAG: hypothetical protein NUV83_03025 [Candidatus Wolfebacteria bacterium]|nr:hypothetical protein [Candidatus Wolfebacteria bacterium]